MAAQGSAAGRGCLGGARRSRGGLRILSIQSRIETACTGGVRGGDQGEGSGRVERMSEAHVAEVQAAVGRAESAAAAKLRRNLPMNTVNNNNNNRL